MNEKLFIPPPERCIQLLDGHPAGDLKRVLIMEDDPKQVKALRQFLELNHFETSFPATASEALQRVKEEDFDVVVCNMIKSVFAGEMFYKAVQRVRPALCSRFIYITGDKLEPGVDAFILSVNGVKLWKPFENHVLLETINVILKKGTNPVRSDKPKAAAALPVTATTRVAEKQNYPPITQIRALTHLALRSARQSIWFAASNFSPDETLANWLVEAAQRRVSVEIVVPEKTGAQFHDTIPLALRQRFLNAGIVLYEGTLPPSTSRTIIVDREWVCATHGLSSYENVNIINQSAANTFVEAFEKCRPTFRRISLVEKGGSSGIGSGLKKKIESVTDVVSTLTGWVRWSFGAGA